jgi:hypothetical protein
MAREMMPMRTSGDGGKNMRGHRGEPGLDGQRLDSSTRLMKKHGRPSGRSKRRIRR